MTRFITLAGRKQTGKDTSAQMIRKLLTDHAVGDHEVSFGSRGATLAICMDAKIHVVHFADALKKACNVIFGIPLEDMETEEGKQKLTHVEWPEEQFRPIEPNPEDVAQVNNVPVARTYEVVGYIPRHPLVGQPRYMTIREVLQFVGTELFRNQMDPDVWLNSVFLKPWAKDDVVIIADARFPNEAALGRKNGLLIRIERDTGLVGDGHKSENALANYTDYHYTVDNNGSFKELKMHLKSILIQRQFIVSA